MAIDRRRFLKFGLLGAAVPAWALADKPAERRGPPGRVVVLGAGLSGLVAAHELKRTGHQVIVLEAQLRPGGRVQTLRSFSDGLYAEAGAGRIPSTHAVTLRWVRYFGLPLEPFYPTTLSNLTLLRGTRIKTAAGKDIDTSAVPLKLTPQERRIGLSQLGNHYYGSVMKRIGEAIRCDWPADVAELGHVSFADFLRRQGASADAIEYLSLGFERDSALDMIRDSASHGAPALSKIQGGNDRLPRAFASALAGQIRYGCKVVSIDRRGEGVRISYKRGDLTEHVQADEVVCALPFSILRHIEVRPGWPADKQRAVERVAYGPVVRTTFQTGSRYWEREGLNGFGQSDAPFEVWSPSFGKAGKRGLLQAYVYQDLADRLSAMDEEQRTRTLVKEMDKVHPGLPASLEGVVHKSWQNDEWQRGAFVIYPPGDLSMYPLICRPEGHIRFTGEHASPWPGWMQGALVSGMAAAREINGWPATGPCTVVTNSRVSLFDGRTLNGWIAFENGATALVSSDILDLPAFIAKLSNGNDSVAAFLRAFQLDFSSPKALARRINQAVWGPVIYNKERFSGVVLRPGTASLLQQNPSGEKLQRLNRLLLEDAYPQEIAKSSTVGWVVKNGAMASTGSGRGVIYTARDYSRYRLTFTMRHLSGNPDHAAGVLLFCTRPAPGERPLEGLGGIQFQVPNGGHWDYRPGQDNDGGAKFTRLAETRFDPHEWTRVEVVADATKGTARMSAAQPPESKLVEVLAFEEPTAGKVGPIAWQMHNRGLLDEYKDVFIEQEPK